MKPVSMTINGERVEALVEPRTHLGDFLRDHLRLTGTHLGCEHGVCGACTVLIDEEPARSCIAYAVACEGREIRTIEGFEDDELMKRLRSAFSREHALQCGFCTPGMLITSRDICRRLPGADEQRIRVELSGNLCRCTGYVGIVSAVKSVAGGASQGSEAAQAATAAAVAEPVSAPLKPFEPVVEKSMPPAAAPAPIDRKSGTCIEERLVVPHPPEQVWKIMSDLPAAASCLPGAELDEHDEHSAKGRIKIKFGPMAASFVGTAGLERDDALMRGVIRGAGTDSLSQSRARGDIVYRLFPEGRDSTRVEIELDYSLTGPLAQFSRSGLVRDFASRLIAEFGRNLSARIAGAPAVQAAEIRGGSLFVAVLWQRIKDIFKRGEKS